MVAVSPEKILKSWMARWGPLDEDLQTRFLNRDEVRELEMFSTAEVQEAIGKHKKLKDVLGEVRVNSYWEPRRSFRPRGDMINRPGPPEDSRSKM